MYFLSDTIAEGMKSAKTTRRRISATRQNTKKKSVRKQKRHNHHSRKRTRRHRRQRGGVDDRKPTDRTIDGEAIYTNGTVVTTSDGGVLSVEEFLKRQSNGEGLDV